MALALALLLAEATIAWPVGPAPVADRCDPPAAPAGWHYVGPHARGRD